MKFTFGLKRNLIFSYKYTVFQVVTNAMKEDQAGKRTESEKHAIVIVREVPVMSWC